MADASLFPRPFALVGSAQQEHGLRLVDALMHVGFDARWVRDGADMLDTLARSTSKTERDVDVVVTTAILPVVDGVTIAEELRAQRWERPIIVVNNGADRHVAHRLSHVPHCEVISHAIDLQHLAAALAFLGCR